MSAIIWLIENELCLLAILTHIQTLSSYEHHIVSLSPVLLQLIPSQIKPYQSKIKLISHILQGRTETHLKKNAYKFKDYIDREEGLMLIVGQLENQNSQHTASFLLEYTDIPRMYLHDSISPAFDKITGSPNCPYLYINKCSSISNVIMHPQQDHHVFTYKKDHVDLAKNSGIHYYTMIYVYNIDLVEDIFRSMTPNQYYIVFFNYDLPNDAIFSTIEKLTSINQGNHYRVILEPDIAKQLSPQLDPSSMIYAMNTSMAYWMTSCDELIVACGDITTVHIHQCDDPVAEQIQYIANEAGINSTWHNTVSFSR